MSNCESKYCGKHGVCCRKGMLQACQFVLPPRTDALLVGGWCVRTFIIAGVRAGERACACESRVSACMREAARAGRSHPFTFDAAMR